MAQENEYELVVSQGKRSIWERILAAIFFTGMIYVFYIDARMFFYAGFTEKTFRLAVNTLFGISFCFAGGVAFSVTKDILIDTDKNKLISRFCIGPFSRAVISEVPQLEYVAVFLDAKEYFQVNLWYKGNKHYTMFCFEEKQPAMKFAEAAANKLNIDLLDATEKGNSKWIEKSAS